jgi:hypothetical protein
LVRVPQLAPGERESCHRVCVTGVAEQMRIRPFRSRISHALPKSLSNVLTTPTDSESRADAAPHPGMRATSLLPARVPAHSGHALRLLRRHPIMVRARALKKLALPHMPSATTRHADHRTAYQCHRGARGGRVMTVTSRQLAELARRARQSLQPAPAPAPPPVTLAAFAVTTASSEIAPTHHRHTHTAIVLGPDNSSGSNSRKAR